MKLPKLPQNPKARAAIMVGVIAGGLLAMMKFRGGSTSTAAAPVSQIPTYDPAATSAMMDASGGVYAPSSGTVTNDLADSLVHQYTDLQGALDGLSGQLSSIGDTIGSLTPTAASSPTSTPDAVTPAPAPTAAAPVSSPTQSAAHQGLAGFLRNGTQMLWRNKEGATAGATVNQAQRSAINDAARLVNKLHKGTKFHIPGVNGTYFMNKQTNFERVD